jgi:hypothetical protein
MFYRYQSPSQCSLPCFEGLFDTPHEKIILDLLFVFALWHGNAKYRVHTDTTVAQFERITSKLGQLLRLFKNRVCTAFETQETPKEAEARQRRELRRKTKHPTYFTSTAVRKTVIKKTFNLETPKLHALGDYAREIPKRGTSDNYTTQRVIFSFDSYPCFTDDPFPRVNASTNSLKTCSRQQTSTTTSSKSDKRYNAKSRSPLSMTVFQNIQTQHPPKLQANHSPSRILTLDIILVRERDFGKIFLRGSMKIDWILL